MDLLLKLPGVALLLLLVTLAAGFPTRNTDIEGSGGQRFDPAVSADEDREAADADADASGAGNESEMPDHNMASIKLNAEEEEFSPADKEEQTEKKEGTEQVRHARSTEEKGETGEDLKDEFETFHEGHEDSSASGESSLDAVSEDQGEESHAVSKRNASSNELESTKADGSAEKEDLEENLESGPEPEQSDMVKRSAVDESVKATPEFDPEAEVARDNEEAATDKERVNEKDVLSAPDAVAEGNPVREKRETHISFPGNMDAEATVEEIEAEEEATDDDEPYVAPIQSGGEEGGEERQVRSAEELEAAVEEAEEVKRKEDEAAKIARVLASLEEAQKEARVALVKTEEQERQEREIRRFFPVFRTDGGLFADDERFGSLDF